MYDINTKNVKKGRTFFILIILAVLLTFGLVGMLGISNVKKYNSLDYKTKAIRVDDNPHTNSDNETIYSPIFYYEVNGTEYKCESDGSSNVSPDHSNPVVYFDSKNPSRCMTSYAKNVNFIPLALLIGPLIITPLGLIKIHKINKKLKKIKYLNEHGKLVKNIPYTLEDTNVTIMNKVIKKPVINYVTQLGEVIKLEGDPRYDHKTSDADNMVDLVIDENDLTNYFIDFEINRLSGNLPSDYYQQPMKFDK